MLEEAAETDETAELYRELYLALSLLRTDEVSSVQMMPMTMQQITHRKLEIWQRNRCYRGIY